jgi:hypothetical protein
VRALRVIAVVGLCAFVVLFACLLAGVAVFVDSPPVTTGSAVE